MTRAHLNLIIACVAIIGTVGYVACLIIAPRQAITFGVGYIILLLSAPLITRWIQRR